MKVLLILVDGMRPDAIRNLPLARKFAARSATTFQAKTVFPSITLPCHMSLFHSVEPARHGTTTNTYAPQVRPIRGLCEVLAAAGKRSAFFYMWENLRDLTRPGSLVYAHYQKLKAKGYTYEQVNDQLTDAAIAYLSTHDDVDFTFLYLGYPDEAGHDYGWMSPEYMDSLENSWKNIDRVLEILPEDYTVIVTADHGGHDRLHGTELPEDIQIPLYICGPNFAPGSTLPDAHIMDIAPTVAKLLGVEPDEDWEGTDLL